MVGGAHPCDASRCSREFKSKGATAMLSVLAADLRREGLLGEGQDLKWNFTGEPTCVQGEGAWCANAHAPRTLVAAAEHGKSCVDRFFAHVKNRLLAAAIRGDVIATAEQLTSFINGLSPGGRGEQRGVATARARATHHTHVLCHPPVPLTAYSRDAPRVQLCCWTTRLIRCCTSLT